mmetsp:Transcript_2554/g.7579  ORF Transcript_2554/g.7579 Transcript_2554/m.7579 type:complete len:715 (+) Transcript_2554:108-2252(+)
MGKDKMMDSMARNQQKWEKKKEKLEKKSQTARGSLRQSEKEQKRVDKEHKEGAIKEQRDNRIEKMVGSKVFFARTVACALVIGFYLAVMVAIMRQGKSSARKDDAHSDDANAEASKTGEVEGGVASLWAALPAALTTLMVAALTAVCVGGEMWKEKLLKQEEQREAAGLIKGQLERKQTEKEREERAVERRLQQQKEARERSQRRAQEEEAALQQARELARAMRRRREEREAEEARARAAGQLPDDGACDEHGWTARQYGKLREAARQYPEGWSHSRKQRWDMIAAEVGGGKDARNCEATAARLEAEARAAAAKVKEAQEGKSHASVASVEEDLDWMTGGFDDDSTALGEGDDGDEEEEEDEDEEQPGRERMAVELEPDHRGTEIRLEGIKAMHGCSSVQVELLHLQLSCADCRASTSLFLSGADEDAADAKTWCEGCASLLSVRLRPTLVHSASSRLCYVDCVQCIVTDVLPSVLMSVCVNCNADNVHKQEFTRNRILEGSCFKCHARYVFGAEAIRVEQITPCEKRSGGARQQAKSSKDDGDPMDEIAEELRWLRKKAKSDPRQQLIQLGKPLPQMGACRHFKKSYKWYRFACCGRAFPCPECHLESSCPAAALGAHANRMICGKCSMEQSYSAARPCEKCGFIMMARGSSHWDDGAGTRSLTAMSTKDAKKFKGGLRQANSKAKTSSGKADRVGAKAKAKREHAKVFGKEK